MPTYAHGSFEEDVALELARLQAAGIKEAVIVDLTKPVFGIPVVRAVVPGLENRGHGPTYQPGERGLALAARLRDDGGDQP